MSYSESTTYPDDEFEMSQPMKRARSSQSAAVAAVSRPSAKSVIRTVNRKKAQNLKLAIGKVITSLAERKVSNFSDTISLTSAFTSGALSIGALLRPVSPYNTLGLTIATGSTVSGRTANKIRPVKCTLKYIIYPNVYDGTINPEPQPMVVRVWFFKPKPGDQTTFTPSVAGFFQNGASTSNFAGTLIDMNKSVNTENYTLLGYKTFKVGMANSAYASITYGGYANYANNDYKMNYIGEINVTKYLAKQYVFDDSDNTPTNTPTYMVWEAVNADNSAMVAGAYPASVRYELQMNYVDF